MAQVNHGPFLIRTNPAPPAVDAAGAKARHRRDVLCFQQHAELVSSISLAEPHRIVGLAADEIDIEIRGNHLRDVLKAAAKYAIAVIEDTNERVALGTIDAHGIDGLLSDIISDVTGAFSEAARRTAENDAGAGGDPRYDGGSRR